MLALGPSFAAQAVERGKVATWYYRCELDDTDQPYSLWVPRDYDAGKKWPLAIQLHGLGGSHRIGGPPKELEDWVLASPDGRGNTDYKLWGELDVVRVVEEVKRNLSIDPDRVVLYGFSMGGSGAWQVGVHYPDLFAALGPVCGNADHRVWERLWGWGEKHPTWMSPKKAWVEATESPAFFAENLINLPSWPIHGDKDNVVPCDHSRSMAAELAKAGAPCFYAEVPGAGHGLPGERVAEMLRWLREQRRDPWPRRVVFKTAWRRHPGAYWVRIHRFERPFAFARIEAEALDKSTVRVKTENVEELSLNLAAPLFEAGRAIRVSVDGSEQYRGKAPDGGWLRLRKQGRRWLPSKPPDGLHKTPQLEGPVQHAFMSSFLIVFGASGDDERAKRVAADEAKLLADHWNRWARGKCRIKPDHEVTEDDIARCNLILVGDPATNSLIPRVMPGLPIRIEGNTIAFGEKRFEGEDLGLKLVYPNPLNPQRYVALFTGTTWRGVFEIVGRFGNWFDWGILDGFHWADFEVFDDLTWGPETARAIGYFDNDWRLNPDWHVTGDEKLRHARPPRRTPQYRAPPEGIGEMYLSDLEPAFTRPEKGCVGRDRSFNAFPITLGGRTYERGLGIHPNCEIGFNLGGQFSVFEAVVGADLEGEESVSEARDKAESFEFLVVGDGRTLYQTGRMKWNSEPRHIYVPIPGVRTLELKMQRRSGPRWLSGPASWAIARVGEPLHNRVALWVPPSTSSLRVEPGVKPDEHPQAKPLEGGTLVGTVPLDGAWALSGLPVGEGLPREAHRAGLPWVSPSTSSLRVPPGARSEDHPQAKSLEGGTQDGVFTAPVPGSVYSALGVAPGDQAMLRDILDTEWWYWRGFELPADWAGRSVWLELDGAAYQTDAWLNGRWVGRLMGPFAQGRFEATLAAKLGARNALAVRVVASPADFVKGGEPFKPTPPRRLVTAQELAAQGTPPLGIWQPVRMRSAGPCILRDLAVETLELTEDATRLRITAEVVSLVGQSLEVTLAGSIEEEPPAGSKPAGGFEQRVVVDGQKTARVEVEVAIANPKLWWPRGFGEQCLYRLAASLRLEGGAVSDEAALSFGIRSIELAPCEGIARLRVNGQGLGVRGAMWLPADVHLRLEPARYERLLARACEGGFNTLRVAGGGLAETDAFYALCDRMGLLVLQELPLAPEGAAASVDEYLLNASSAIRRIRAHPSLVAWCLGGAPDARLAGESAALCQRLDPQRRILGDSPRSGQAQLWDVRIDPASGRVTWQAASLLHVPGIASPSAFDTLFEGAREPEWPSSDPWAAASARAAAPYGASESAREHVAKAQLAQAVAVRNAAERHRLAPRAEVFWQLNESQPGSSPALLDASGTPKPAWHFLRRALADVAVFADFGGEVPLAIPVGGSLRVEVCVASRHAPLRGARVAATVLDRAMRPLMLRECRFDAETGIVGRPLAFEWCAEPQLAGDVAFLHLRLDDAEGRRLASNLYWFGVTPPRKPPARPLRIAWLTRRPRGPLADPAFLAAAGIEVHQLPARPFAAAQGEPAGGPLEGFDAIVFDNAQPPAGSKPAGGSLDAIVQAVSEGCGLLIEGADKAAFDSPIGPLLPARPRPAGPSPRGPARPAALVPGHPILARIELAHCPPLPRCIPLEPSEPEAVLVQLDAEHPLLLEGRHGEGRVLLLAAGGELAAWGDLPRFYAAMLGYLARLPHREMVRMAEAAGGAPLEALGRLAPATIEARLIEEDGAPAVELANVSSALAFLVSLEASEPQRGAAVLAGFSDNFLSLLPGERRVVRIERPAAAPLSLTVRGWNTAPQRLLGAP